MSEPSSIVVVPRRPQPKLRKLADRDGVTPIEFVQQKLVNAGTVTGAAEAAEVDVRTFREWMRRLNVRLVRAG